MPFPSLMVGSKGREVVDGVVELPDGSQRRRLVVDAFEQFDKFLQGVGLDEMRIVELVFAVEQVVDLMVEDLPGELLGLLQHRTAKLCVGVVAEIDALIDEALAPGIQHDAEEVADLAVVLAFEMRQVEVAVVRHMQVHRGRVTTLEQAMRLGAKLERQLEPVSGIVRRAAHLRLHPLLSDVLGPQFGAGFEAAATKNNRPGR